MESGLGPKATCGDHELGRARLLPSRVKVERTAARPQPRPTASGRFMENVMVFSGLLGGHEPKVPRT